MNVVDSKLDVIVVNYQTPDDLWEFGESYLAQDYASTLVIVNVVPGVQDREIAQTIISQSPGSMYMEFDENCGYATAVNRAASQTSSPVIAIFNADVILSANSLKKCTEDLQLDETWGALGPMQTNLRGQMTHAGIYGTHRAPSFAGFWLKQPEIQNRVLRDDCVSISGSAYFVRRSVWDEMTACPIFRKRYPDIEGAFLPTKHYYEETYLSYHMHAHGYRVIYDGNVEIIHKWHQASPVGGFAEQQTVASLEMFREACDDHDIYHE